jgi:hypothetical protein
MIRTGRMIESKGKRSGTAVAAPSARRRSGVAFGGFGFLLGIVFWHFVGFWDFVGGVLLNRAGSMAQVDDRVPKQATRFVDVPQVAGEKIELVQINPEPCTALVLNRATGTMTVAPCPEAAMPVRSSRTSGREDASLMPVRRNVSTGLTWSTTVEQQAMAEN